MREKIVQGTTVAGINNVIYMELFSGPKMANGICGKTIDTGTIDRGSTVLKYIVYIKIYNNVTFPILLWMHGTRSLTLREEQNMLGRMLENIWT
jgi:hypothetical protein